jgi:exportin-2 (importin alpha re-exporter)
MNSLTVMDNIVDKLKVLKIIMRLFYYLNFQDLHPKFEDNLNSWMTLM